MTVADDLEAARASLVMINPAPYNAEAPPAALEGDITPTELHCLHLLHGGVSDSPTELARLLGMSTGAFTRLLDRMERHRLAERAPDPADRRRLVVRPLPDRMAELAELYAPMARFVGDRLARFDRRQLTALLEFLTDGTAAAERSTTRLPDVTQAITS